MGLEQFKRPEVTILYNDVDKTDAIHWTDIQISDFESDEADTLSVTMLWSNAKPREDDNIKIFIDGYFLGSFTITTIKYNYLVSFEIEAISANYFKEFRQKKNRTFLDKSYKDILTQIAKENGYNLKIDFERMDEVGDLEQYDLSDCAFCKKIADDLEITFCVKNDTLIFIDKDKETKRTEYFLNDDEIFNLSYQINHAKIFNSCEIKWFDTKTNKSVVSKVGKGTPVLKFSDFARDKHEALRKANAKLKRQKNSVLAGSVSTISKPFFAGGYLTLNLKDEPFKLRALISKITHKINTSWTCEIEFA
ncbi:phage late control D family protein [Campylobacter gastrosuis]|uniref:Phage tail protein n=1 Tax=Campylobacter gastrosuis TaxID=2974576 RepID=A0ABT7HSQ3_9BACT|nr:phage tail protein [Campylobacter gastrosuis]MDL0089947.1 phage tail protein [Campylobacter gastrosuis]